MLPEVRAAEEQLFGSKVAEVDTYSLGSGGSLQDTLAVMGGCKPHDCSDHNAMWTVDFSSGHAGRVAGEITDESEVVVYLGDYARPQDDLTGSFCTSGSEREFTLEGRWYADEEIQAGADRNAAPTD
jgi:hypothetical protein